MDTHTQSLNELNYREDQALPGEERRAVAFILPVGVVPTRGSGAADPAQAERLCWERRKHPTFQQPGELVW